MLEDPSPPWRRKWQPAPVFLPGESHGQRSPVGIELHMTEQPTLSNSFSSREIRTVPGWHLLRKHHVPGLLVATERVFYLSYLSWRSCETVLIVTLSSQRRKPRPRLRGRSSKVALVVKGQGDGSSPVAAEPRPSATAAPPSGMGRGSRPQGPSEASFLLQHSRLQPPPQSVKGEDHRLLGLLHPEGSAEC